MDCGRPCHGGRRSEPGRATAGPELEIIREKKGGKTEHLPGDAICMFYKCQLICGDGKQVVVSGRRLGSGRRWRKGRSKGSRGSESLGVVEPLKRDTPNTLSFLLIYIYIYIISRNFHPFGTLLFQGGTNPEGKNLAEHCLPVCRGVGGRPAWPPVCPCPAGAARGRGRLRVPGPHSGFKALRVFAKASPGRTLPSPHCTSSHSCLKGCSLAGRGARPIPELCAPSTWSHSSAAGEGTVRCASSQERRLFGTCLPPAVWVSLSRLLGWGAGRGPWQSLEMAGDGRQDQTSKPECPGSRSLCSTPRGGSRLRGPGTDGRWSEWDPGLPRGLEQQGLVASALWPPPSAWQGLAWAPGTVLPHPRVRPQNGGSSHPAADGEEARPRTVQSEASLGRSGRRGNSTLGV